MSLLTPFAEELWTVAAPMSLAGLQLGTRMTVVRQKDGGLLLHSPVPIDEALARQLTALGPVSHIVAPNAFHHFHVGPAMARFPEARSYGAPGLARKRPDLRFGATFTEETPLPFSGELLPLTIRGSMLGETVLLHRRSGTVVSSDLTENWKTHEHLPTRLYLKAAGLHGKPGWSRFLRFFYRDHKAARESIDRLLKWDFDKAVIAHGDPLSSGAKRAVEQSFSWL
jgi:Domain of unknown function (DUF4336)